MQSARLDSLEKRTYRAAVDHGFFDLLLGVAAVIFTLALAVSPWFMLAVVALVIGKRALLKGFNRRVVEPRAGHVRLGPARLEQIGTARKSAALAFFGLALVVARLGDVASPISSAAPLVWLSGNPEFQLAIIVGVCAAVAGWLFELPRFMAYGLLIVLVPFVGAVAGLPAGTGWAIATLVILASGCRVLYRFVSDNPEARA